MFYAVVVAASMALFWTVLSSLGDSSNRLVPRNPTTIELLMMAMITLAAYSWAKRRDALRELSQARETEIADADDLGEDPAEHAA